jgi:hypothetical protein
MQDVINAMIIYLKTQSDVTDLVSTRIYGGELPESEIVNMPRKLIVLRYAGGPEEFRTARLQKQRVDIFSYGEGYYQAGQVDLAIAEVLIAMQRVESESTILHAVGYGGSYQLKEPDTGWCYAFRTCTVTAGETAA